MIKLSPTELLNSASNLTTSATSIESKITRLNAKYGSLYSKVKSRGSISSGVSKLREGTNILRNVSRAMKSLVVELNGATSIEQDNLLLDFADDLGMLSMLGSLKNQTSVNIDLASIGYSTQEEIQFYTKYVEPLFGKIDFSKLGYTNEAIAADALIWLHKEGDPNDPLTDWVYAESLLTALNNAPIGFEHLQFYKAPVKDFQAGEVSEQYGIDESTFGDFKYTREIVTIGDYDFQIVQGIRNDMSSPIYDIVMESYKVMVIGQFANYPDKMLETIASDEGLPRILLADDMDWSTGYSYGGFYNPDNGVIAFPTTYLQDYTTFTGAINHEAGHKFDDFYLDSETDNRTIIYDDADNNGVFVHLSESNFATMEKIVPPMPGYEEEYNVDFSDIANREEAFAELSKFYFDYPEQLKYFCPDYYNYFESFLVDETGQVTKTPNLVVVNEQTFEINKVDGIFKVIGN